MKLIFLICIILLLSCATRHAQPEKVVRLRSMSIKTCPDSIFTFKNVTVLDFGPSWVAEGPISGYETPSQNQLQQLPSQFCKLRSLKQLDLSYNDMRDIPDCLATLPHLKHIDLSYN